MPFLPLLALIFITLKLCDIVAWSWWLVLMPLWIIPFIVLSIVILALIFKGD